jgi:acid phosphatase type 7
MRALWTVLYKFGVDMVVNGHDHHYEHFAPQTPDGALDLKRGIRQFIVGTGGADFYDLRTVRANSEVQNSTAWGVLKFTLHAASYDWEFIPAAGGTFRDGGTAVCVP